MPEQGKRSVETVHNVRAYHTISNEVGKIAKKVNAKNLVLTHFVPPNFDEKKLLEIIALDYEKNTVLGKDLMTIDIKGNLV